ncbi:MAG TPA: hypothetical protein VEV17_23785 [Bryobacteraceae bacterium]|nr:hypothetical protein [Bryobacteraceae bacterium]
MTAALVSCRLGLDSLTFQAQVANLHRRNNSFAKNKAPTDFVEVTLPGRLMQPPIAVNTVERSQADWSTPERAAGSILSANMAGDVPWIIESYVPAERDAARRQLSDSMAAQRNLDYFRNLGQVDIFCRTEVRGFAVLLLRGVDPDGDVTFLTMVLAKTGSGWRQTNSLADDDTFDLVQTAARTGGVH